MISAHKWKPTYENVMNGAKTEPLHSAMRPVYVKFMTECDKKRTLQHARRENGDENISKIPTCSRADLNLVPIHTFTNKYHSFTLMFKK